MGHPHLNITEGYIFWHSDNLADLTTDERSHHGIYVTFQNPLEFDGISNYELVKEIAGAKNIDLQLKYNTICRLLDLKLDHGELDPMRGILSLSEAKRNELIHMILLNPSLVMIDEIDTGLMIEEVALIGAILSDFLQHEDKGCIVITHNQTLLDIIKPTHVHVMFTGEIKLSGGPDLYKRIVEDGYSEFS
jgi:Fe-S cluster assembly ATP-binding protein